MQRPKRTPRLNLPPWATHVIRTGYGALIIGLVAFVSITLYTTHTYEVAQERYMHELTYIAPFPVGVDPVRETISENPVVHTYFEDHIAATIREPMKRNWFWQTVDRIAYSGIIQNLASPVSRVLIIRAGERKEEVVDNFGDILRWNTQERTTFAEHIIMPTPTLTEGKFFPERYVVDADASPEDVALRVREHFEREILRRYTDEVAARVPLQDALTIASLLERESGGFEDMRRVSGVIWNRLFADMKLQIDASLQYVRGSDPYEPYWWPRVHPNDKFIDSPFNTYQHEGLPPTPIGNPSVAAIVAALNPIPTECMFYFHDGRGDFHCSETYEEHVAKIDLHY